VPGQWVSVAPAEPMPGAAGSQVLTIAADSEGTAVISASYDRPWEGGEKGAWTLALTVNVR
jgi:predicted secreted protein